MSRIYFVDKPTDKARVCTECHKGYMDSTANFKGIHRHRGMCPDCSKRFK